MRTGKVSQAVLLAVVIALLGIAGIDARMACAEPKAEKSFTATVTDAQGIETEIKNVVFYWEERLSETAFVPHELRHLPVKRGSSTINVRFDQVKLIENRMPGGADGSTLTITLQNGKTGEFAWSIPGSFRGESDFGQADIPSKAVSKVLFK